MEHNAVLQPLLDYLSATTGLWFTHSSTLHRSQSHVHSEFIFVMKSTASLVFVWNPEADNDTRPYAALFRVNPLSTPACLPLLGKVPFTIWLRLGTIEPIPWAIFCCLPRAGKLLSVDSYFRKLAVEMQLIDEVVLLEETSGRLRMKWQDGLESVFIGTAAVCMIVTFGLLQTI